MTFLRLDITTALRFFARRKSAFAVTVLTVAVAIAANTTAFSVVRAFFFANLGVRDEAAVAVVFTVKNLPGNGLTDFADAYPNYRLLKETTRSFSAIAATVPADANWEQKDETRRLQGTRVTASFFEVMAVKPRLGRFFSASDEGPKAAPVAVISYKLWRSTFADGEVIGASIRLNGTPHTIVGVMPEEFQQPTDTEIWLPFDLPETMWTAVTGGRAINIYARLAPGQTLASANQELRAFAETAIRADAANKDWSWRAKSLREVLLNGSGAAVIFVQIGAAVLLLLAICNLTSVLLAWAAEREHETALRLALGASSARIARQFLVQSLILVGTAGAAALWLSHFALPALKHLNPDRSLGALLRHVEIERGTLLFALAIMLLMTVLAGLLPMWQTRAVALNDSLRGQSRGSGASPRAVRWQKAMIVLQAAISVLILVGALLAGICLAKLGRVHLGFQAKDRVVFRIQFPEPAIDTHEKRVQFMRALKDNLAREPGLAAFAWTTTMPVGDTAWGGSFKPQLSTGEFAEDAVVFQFRRVSPTYTEVMGIPLQEGRIFNERDQADAPRVALVSKTLAKKYWPDQSALGRKLRRTNAAAEEFEIVGVVGEVHDNGPTTAASETVYVPFAQMSQRGVSVVLRSSGPVADTVAAARRALRASNPDVAAFNVQTLDVLASQTLALPRLQFVLFATFAAMAVGITGLGAYGVMCQVVAVREKELAIRSALGATRIEVAAMLLWQNARLALYGTAAGLIAAWLTARGLRSVLPNLEANLVWPFVVVAGAVLGITQLASIVPVRRASRPQFRNLLGV